MMVKVGPDAFFVCDYESWGRNWYTADYNLRGGYYI